MNNKIFSNAKGLQLAVMKKHFQATSIKSILKFIILQADLNGESILNNAAPDLTTIIL